ncbi:early endosome antigen 1-like [Corticium candelabrum]|uniref:early endosome antigen 1-like n=1 Tax=Corticium candelabrum TaxID=121492 RepID=UPI002E274097|nr:early endosome antigen 1-like [Corticium candelabrum]
MGVCLYDQGKYERATEHLRESLNIYRRLPSVNKVCMAGSCAYLSRCLLSQCLTKEAEDVMREGCSLSFSTDDNNSKARAAILLAYTIQLNEGTEKEVKKLLQQADRWTKLIKEGDWKARLLSDMREVLVIRGDYKRANRILQEAATLQRRLLPTNHWETGLTLCCMAECQVKQNKQMDALALFQESSEIINKSMGVEHPVRGRIVLGVAQILQGQQKWEEAESNLKESVNILCVRVGLHPTTSAAIRDLNYCLRMLKKDQEAVDILRQHQRAVSYHQVEHQASAFQDDDLQRELELLRESNRAIQVEKSALQQLLADQETVTRAIIDENEQQVGEIERLLQVVQQCDEDIKQLQTAVRDQKHLAEQKQREANDLQQEITRMKSELDDKEGQLQQQRQELNDMRSTIEEQRRQIDVLRHEVQQQHTTSQCLARGLQRSERAMQQLERLQHQYDSVIQIHDDRLRMTGLKLGKGGYGEVGVGMWSGVAAAVKTFYEEPV